eukprot:scaffold31_cov334-Pavlova_lutheri.AAC.40
MGEDPRKIDVQRRGGKDREEDVDGTGDEKYSVLEEELLPCPSHLEGGTCDGAAMREPCQLDVRFLDGPSIRTPTMPWMSTWAKNTEFSNFQVEEGAHSLPIHSFPSIERRLFERCTNRCQAVLQCYPRLSRPCCPHRSRVALGLVFHSSFCTTGQAGGYGIHNRFKGSTELLRTWFGCGAHNRPDARMSASTARDAPTFASVRPALRPATLVALSEMGFERCTPVQAAVLPLLCGHADVSVDACTGSGKTLSFLVPVAERVASSIEKEELEEAKVMPKAVVVLPTRELARQVHGVAEKLLALAAPGAITALLVGGGGTNRGEGGKQRLEEDMRAHVLVGTPGRLDEAMEQAGNRALKNVEVLVLDEADKLLDMGFQDCIDRILKRLPKQRRTGLFSATQTEAVEQLARAGLRNPMRVCVKQERVTGDKGETKMPLTLKSYYQIVDQEERMEELTKFLLDKKGQKVIVYFLTCACVDFFAALLVRLQQTKCLNIIALHGRMKQAQREKFLQRFDEQSDCVLLTTDVAARGLDFENVNWVLQYDPPQDPAAFLHRSGRTARMGKEGCALVFLQPQEASYVEFLENRKVHMEELPGTEGKIFKDLAAIVRRFCETDRDMLEKGLRAFVSYVRGYQEHHCRYIFVYKELPLGKVATSFGLLRLPKMPEIRKMQGRLVGFQPSDVDPDTVKFSDKLRERQRQKHLLFKARQNEEEKATDMQTAKTPGVAHTIKPEKRTNAEKRRKKLARADLDELDEDYRLWKKRKRGKITEEEYELAAGMD